MGLEPTPGPWQGPVLPLYYDRPEQENSSTTAFRRQVPIAALGKRGYPHSPGQASANPGFITQSYSSTLLVNLTYKRQPVVASRRSAYLQHPGGLDHRRLALAFGKLRSFGVIGIYAGKPLTVFVKHSDLPMLVFSPFIFPKRRTLSFFWCFWFSHTG